MSLSSRDQINLAMKWAAERQDGLNLFRCMPDEFCPQEAAVRSRARHKLPRGGNRSGKTTVAGAMVASIARDKPLTMHNGEQVHCRFDHQRGKPLTIWIVGYDWDHVGDPMFPMLFRENKSLYIIPDENTKAWRAYRPWNAYDRANKHLCKPLPPLIPAHEIVPDSWVWKNKAANIFDQVELTNGTRIYAHSSKDAKAGVVVDWVWVDEKIEYERNVSEWMTRLIDRDGGLLWSTWPTSDNTALRLLSKQAEVEAEEVRKGERAKVTVAEFKFVFSKNPFIDEAKKKEAIERWKLFGDDKARNDGDFMDEGVRWYPQFSMKVSAAIHDGELDDQISQILRARNGEPPADWARFMILDPGTAHPALLFCAVPPPHLGEWFVIYDEIYQSNIDADGLMKLAAPKFEGYAYQTFVIDMKAGQQQGPGYELTVADNYSKAMRKYGIKSANTGFGFVPGSSNIAVRSGQLAAWMTTLPSGHSRLRIVANRCRNLVEQLETNKRKIVNDMAQEYVPGPGAHDLRDTAEYFASIEPLYEVPVLVEPEELVSPADRMKAWLKSVSPDQSSTREHSVLGACGKA